MARHRAGPMTTVFAVAIALALVTAVANSQVIFPIVTISIQNNFPTNDLTVWCASEFPAVVQPHVVLPKEVYKFQSNTEVEQYWKCHLSTGKPGNLCDGPYRGEFLMWQNDNPHSKTHLCSTKCLWFVDKSGLSLIQHPHGKPVHIYDWSGHGC